MCATDHWLEWLCNRPLTSIWMTVYMCYYALVHSLSAWASGPPLCTYRLLTLSPSFRFFTMLSKLNSADAGTASNNLSSLSTIESSQFPTMSVRQEFAVSAAAAGLSHLIHHPLYTLKSQMMFYGPQFQFKEFFRQAREQRTFLYRGEKWWEVVRGV